MSKLHTLKYKPQHSCKPCGKVWQPQQTTPQPVRCSTQLTPPVQTGRSHQRGRNTACRQDGACCAQGQGVQGCAPTNQESQSKPKNIGIVGSVGMQATCKHGGSNAPHAPSKRPIRPAAAYLPTAKTRHISRTTIKPLTTASKAVQNDGPGPNKQRQETMQEHGSDLECPKPKPSHAHKR